MGRITMSSPFILWGRNSHSNRTAANRATSKMQAMVLNATQELQIGPDWASMMEISDLLKRDPDTATSFVTSVVARLKHTNPQCRLLAMQLLQTCMKNIGQDTQLPCTVSDSKDLMAVLAASAEGRKPRRGLFQFRCAASNLHNIDGEDTQGKEQEIQELARVLIRSWAEGFSTIDTEVPMFRTTYMELLKKGLGFPELSNEEKTNFKPRTPAQDETEAIQARVRLLRDMLSTATQKLRGEDVAVELGMELEQTKEDLQQRIPGMGDEEDMMLYIDTLMQVQAALEEYWARVDGNSPAAVCRIPEQQPITATDSDLAQYAPPTPASTKSTTSDHTSSDLADLLGLSQPTMPNEAQLRTLQSG